MTDDEACTRSGCGHGPHGDFCEVEVRSEGEPDGVPCGCPDYAPWLEPSAELVGSDPWSTMGPVPPPPF